MKNCHRGSTAWQFAIQEGSLTWLRMLNCQAVGPLGDVSTIGPAFQTGLGKLLDLWPEFKTKHIRLPGTDKESCPCLLDRWAETVLAFAGGFQRFPRVLFNAGITLAGQPLIQFGGKLLFAFG